MVTRGVPGGAWTRRFGDEYLAGYTSPLTAGLLVPWIVDEFLRDLARASGNRVAEACEPLCRHHGHIYLGGDYLAAMLRAVPRRFRRAATMNWFPPSWTAHVERQPWAPRLALGMLRARRRDPRSSLHANPRALDRHFLRIEELVVPRLAQVHAALSTAEWRRQLDEACELGREHFRVIRWGVGIATPALHAVLRWSLRSTAGDRDGELYRSITGGLSGTRTSEVDRDVWRLAEEARRDAGLAALLLRGDGVDTVRAARPDAPFWGAFDGFLERNGHRAPARDIALPRWCETPDTVLGLVRAHLGAQPGADPGIAVDAALRRRHEAQGTALRRASAGPLGALRRAALERLFRHAAVHTRDRENQRFHLDYLLLHIRLLALEMGRRLVAAGVLDDPDEVFLLEPEELRSAAERPVPNATLRERIDERMREWREWRNRLPATFLVDGVETEAEMAAGRDAITGVGVSGGRARGRTRVVRDVSGLAELRPGEILVTGTADPGWTGVFPLLAGIVTETGGVLSHAAILAREYGLPAVLGVVDATRRIRTGDLLELDGGEGWVRRIERP
jgi:phosphohistidine swiveling domain-containing protein